MKKVSFGFLLFLISSFLFFTHINSASAVSAFSVAPVTVGTDNLMGATANWFFNATSSVQLERGDVVQFIAPTVSMGQSFNLSSVVANSFSGSVDLYTALGASLSNVLTNPSFESSTSSWAATNMGGTSYVYPTSTVSNNIVDGGSGAVQLDVDNSGNLIGNDQSSLSVVAGNSYSLSFYARGQVGGETARILLSSTGSISCPEGQPYFFNFLTQTWGCATLPGDLAPGSAFVFDSALTNTFARFSTTTIIATSSMQLSLVGGGDVSFANQTIIFDDVQLEAGTTVTAYNAGGVGADTQGVGVNQNIIYGLVSSTVPVVPAEAAFTINLGGIVNAMRPLQDSSPLNWQMKIGTPVDSNQPWGSLSLQKVFINDAAMSLSRAGHALVSDVNSSITPSSYSTSATNVDYTFVFTTSSTIPVGGKIALNFPADFNISSATVLLANNGNINASSTSMAQIADNAIVTSTTNGLNRILLTTSNAAVVAGETVTVKVGGITNPASANAYRGFFVYTTKTNNGLLDGSPSGFGDESGYGSLPPVDTVHIGGTNKLHVVVKKKLADGTIQTLSAGERAQVLVGVGCMDKGFFVGNRFLNSSGQADFNNLLDCNYTIGTPPVDSSDPTFFDNFLQPAMANVQAVGGVEATTTIYYGVPDAAVTFRITGGVAGQFGFISAHSSDFESQSPLFSDPALTIPGFSATGTGYASIKVRSGQTWAFSAQGGSFGNNGGNFSSGGTTYWPPSISPLFVAAATTYDIGSFAYVPADKTLNVSLVGAGGAVPITNACVGVKRSGGGMFMGAQDTICQPNSGDNYQFKVPLGSISIEIMRQGFGAPQEFSVAITGNTTNKTISLSVPTTYIKVIVKDSNDLPINGAPVFVHGINGFGQSMTDSSGSSTIYIAPGTYTVEGFAPGFGPLTAQSNVTVSGEVNPTITFTVDSGNFKTITGIVTQDGSPLGGIKIGARGTNATTGGNGTETLSDGTYILRVPSGQYEVGGWSPDTGGLEPQTANLSVLDTVVLNWTLAAQGTLRIVVQNSSNVSPLFGGAFDATTGRGNGTDSWTASGNDKFADIRLPAGTYNVHVGSPMVGEIGNVEIVVVAGETVTQTFNAATGVTVVTLSGSVTSTADGLGVANVNIWASRLNGPGFFSTQTDSDGNYSLNVPDAFSYKVGAKTLGYIPVQGDVTVAVSGNTVQNFTLTPSASTVSGTITNGVTPISGAWVSAKKTINGYDTWTGVQTDANGEYTLNVDNGSWTIYAEGPCYYRSSGLTGTIADNNVSNADISLTSINACSAPTPEVHGLTASSGGQVSRNNLILDIPANALGTTNSSVSVQVSSASMVVSSPNATPLSNAVQSITATDSTGQSITNLGSNVNLTITYDPADLPNGFDESTLQLGYFDTTSGQWEAVAATVDTTNNTLTASVSHFTDYGPILPGVPTAPANLSATAASASAINLTWDAVPTATTYKIYRSTDNSTFTSIATGITEASYQSSGLTASTLYYYKVAGVNASGEGIQSSSDSATTEAAAQVQPQSNNAGGGGSGIDYTAPTNTSIIINSGATSTTSATVNLTLAASSDATQMMISNESSFVGAVWENFVISKTWQVTSTTGNKIVYAKFKDNANNISSAVSDSIVLVSSSVVVPVTPVVTPAPASTVVVVPETEVVLAVAEIILSKPDSAIAISKISNASLQPGSLLTFDYQYKNNTDKKVTVKLLRQLVNSKGKVVSTSRATRTLKPGLDFTIHAQQYISKYWLPGEYTVKIKILDNKNVVLEENGFNINVEKLKKKYFSLGNVENENSAIVFTPSVLNKVKSGIALPVALKLKYEYINQTGAKQTIRMTRRLVDSKGKIISTRSGKWTMKPGEKDSVSINQPVAANLAAGNYTIKITAADWNTKEEVAANSIGFTVELK